MRQDITDSSGRKLRLLRPLGKGGFGAVYLSEVRTSGGLVQRLAVKVLHEEMMEDAELAARARDEARLMSQLNHDNVVKVHALTSIGGRAAVLMEYVEGIDCSTLVAQTLQGADPGLPTTVACAIVERSASALHAAWTTLSPQTGEPLRVVHRDIKPSNLLVSVGGAVKVMDFGVARAEFEREAETQSMQFGTQRYMAPERWLHGESGPASDIYSLGVTFAELLSGVRFERLPLAQPSFVEARDRQLEVLSGEPEPVIAMVRSMLAYSSADRPTAARVEDALGHLIEEIPGPPLRRYCRKRVPALVQLRLARLANDPQLSDFTETFAKSEPSRRFNSAETGPAVSAPNSLVATAPQESTVAEPAPALAATADWPMPGVVPADPEPADEAPIRGVSLLGYMLLGMAIVGVIGGGVLWKTLGRPDAVADVEVGAEFEPAVELSVVDEPVAAPVEGPPELDAPVADAAELVPDPSPAPPAVTPRPRAAPAVVEPSPEPALPEPEPLVVEPPSAQAEPTKASPAAVKVEKLPAPVVLKVRASPGGGTLTTDGGRTAGFGKDITLSEGTWSFRYEWTDGVVECRKTITAEMSNLKFNRDKEPKCMAY